MDQAIKTALVSAYLFDYFEQLPPSHQREYIQWIMNAQKEATKAKRITQMIEMLRSKVTGIIASTARAIILNSKGELLMIEREKEGRRFFVLPGGHCQADETPEKAVIREVLEETGLHIKIQHLLYTHLDAFHNQESIFLCHMLRETMPALGQTSPERQGMLASGQIWRPGWFSVAFLRDQVVYPEDLLGMLSKILLFD